jgi:hypothetical protein
MAAATLPKSPTESQTTALVRIMRDGEEVDISFAPLRLTRPGPDDREPFRSREAEFMASARRRQ